MKGLNLYITNEMAGIIMPLNMKSDLILVHYNRTAFLRVNGQLIKCSKELLEMIARNNGFISVDQLFERSTGIFHSLIFGYGNTLSET